MSNDCFQGVSNCYVFKSRLQEYAQKVGLSTPVYETIKEGPSHEPSFKSTVIVNNVRYDSLPGFFNRKAAEQSAAEVALLGLADAGKINECISQPVHATGLCKNLLQEYAQKMNYAIPSYECRKDERQGRVPHFSCTVEIGGIKYIGAAAKTKKEAEIKAARTALLAIQTSGSESNEKATGNSMYTVIPSKKKATDSGIGTQETATALKPKKSPFKKKSQRKRHIGDKGNHIKVENTGNLEVLIDDREGQQLDHANADSGLLTLETKRNFQGQRLSSNGNGGHKSAVESALVLYRNPLDLCQSVTGTPTGLISRVSEANPIPGIEQVASMLNNSSMCQAELPWIIDCLNQTACGGSSRSKQV